MSEVTWTKEQLQAIEEKGSNILVAAAAGSGKTAVLVERIIHKVLQEKMDIHQMLVVTFTNAAASEMRQRILDAIYARLEKDPEDEHMQRQTVLIAKSNICTIHSFCLEVIRNNFFEIGVSPNFRIAEQTEMELLKQEILEEIFEKKYEEQAPEFMKLLHTYTTYQTDEPLKELILNVYRYIQSSPFPEEWLEEAVEVFNVQEANRDFATTTWGNILRDTFLEEIQSCEIELGSIQKQLEYYPELEKFKMTIQQDREQMEQLLQQHTWDSLYSLANTLKFETWPREKVVIQMKETAKEKRDAVKKKFNTIKDRIMWQESKGAMEDIEEMYPVMKALKDLVLEFSIAFAKGKEEKNVIDFHDIEHFALNILVKKNEQGKYEPTTVAKKYQEKFEEIAIDEYQDSNLVQEYILSTISKGNNIFMVGDVKQSIYRFRQARPELFIQKYESYQKKEEQKQGDCLKIQLFKNFRSRKAVLDITNLVFQNIMTKQLGDIDYTQEEYLNLGANFTQTESDTNCAGISQLHIIEKKEAPAQEEQEFQQETQPIEDVVVEAKFVANHIKELLQSSFQVQDKKIGYRQVQCRDIVILLRATSVLAPIYEKELSELEIPVFSDTSSQYLDTVEIQTVLSILKIMDNPRQDIPLVTVLRSVIGGLDDNDLLSLKIEGRQKGQTCFYETLIKGKETVDTVIQEKVNALLKQLETWRKQQEYLALDELIWNIYLDTGYYHYVSLMPNGALRQANLKMLFEKAKQYESASFKGLFNFINFMDKVKMNHSDMDSAKLIGENENVVRIMSIHKSKGLEFPVVYLCGTGKKFNMQDLNESILLHQDIGLGPNYIDEERKIQYNTLAKEAIRYQTRKETIAEEMRVLYVALTRAKEKLIITGLGNQIEKELTKKEELLSMYEGENIPSAIVKNYISYLDWLELVYLRNKDNKEAIRLEIHQKEEITQAPQKEEEEEVLERKSVEQEENYQKIKQMLEWNYPEKEASKIPTKVSVSQIKELEQEETKDKIPNKTMEKKVPKFLMQEIKVTKAKLGTVMHLCIQRMQEKEEYTKEKIEDMLKELVAKQLVTEQEAAMLPVAQLWQYTQSVLWKELKKAKQIQKEQPFYLTLPANQIYKTQTKENILVQGIIDLYYIDEQDNLILVDYKTDRIQKTGQELVDKYAVQLQVYQKALEQAMQRKVDKIYIYSTQLGERILVST